MLRAILVLALLTVSRPEAATAQTASTGLKLRLHGGGGISTSGVTGSLGASLSGHKVFGGFRYLTSDISPVFGGNAREFVGAHFGVSERFSNGRWGISAGIGRLTGENEVRRVVECFLSCPTERIQPRVSFLLLGHAIISLQALGIGIEPFAIISSNSPYAGITINVYAGKF